MGVQAPCGTDLVVRDLRFGLEDGVLGHAGSGPANRIGCPIFGMVRAERRPDRSRPRTPFLAGTGLIYRPE